MKKDKSHLWFHSPIGKAVYENPEGFVPVDNKVLTKKGVILAGKGRKLINKL